MTMIYIPHGQMMGSRPSQPHVIMLEYDQDYSTYSSSDESEDSFIGLEKIKFLGIQCHYDEYKSARSVLAPCSGAIIAPDGGDGVLQSVDLIGRELIEIKDPKIADCVFHFFPTERVICFNWASEEIQNRPVRQIADDPSKYSLVYSVNSYDPVSQMRVIRSNPPIHQVQNNFPLTSGYSFASGVSAAVKESALLIKEALKNRDPELDEMLFVLKEAEVSNIKISDPESHVLCASPCYHKPVMAAKSGATKSPPYGIQDIFFTFSQISLVGY